MTTTASRLVPLRTKMSYALGASTEGITGWALTAFSFVVYSVVFGMPGTLVGLAISASILIDGFTDPYIGYISDRWRSRWGRRHPFIFFAALPLAASIFCVFSPPAFLLAASSEELTYLGYTATSTQWGLFLWLFVFASLYKFFFTCYFLPHLALGSELSEDYLERTKVFRYNTFASMISGAILAQLFYQVFFSDGPQLGLDTSYFAAFIAIVGGSVVFLTAYLTRDQIPNLQQPPEDQPKGSPRGFFIEALALFENKNYQMLVLGLLFLASMTGVRETMSAHMALYYWEITPALIGFLSWFSIASYFAVLAVVAKLHLRFEKSGSMRIAVIISATAACLPVTLRSLGWLPDNESQTAIFVVVGLSVFFYYGGLAILTTSVYSAIGDIADQEELKTGRRSEGMMYSVRIFISKLSNALGHLLAGVAIDFIGFVPGSKVGEVPEDVLFSMGLFEGPIAAFPVLGAIYFYGKYKIDATLQQQNLVALQAQRVKKEQDGLPSTDNVEGVPV